MKKLLLLTTLLATNVFAQGTFNGAVSNPFALCSAPRPCDKCQPLRRLYDEVCPAGDASRFPAAVNAPTQITQDDLSKAKQLDKNITNNSASKEAMDLENKTYSTLGVQKPIGLQDHIKVRTLEQFVVDNVTVGIVRHQEIDRQIIQDQYGNNYKNNKVISEFIEYKGKQYSSIGQVQSVVRDEISRNIPVQSKANGQSTTEVQYLR